MAARVLVGENGSFSVTGNTLEKYQNLVFPRALPPRNPSY